MIAPMSGLSNLADLAKTEMNSNNLRKVRGDFKDILKEKNEKKLRKATQQFAGIFIYQMIKAMRKTVPKNGLIYGGMSEDIWQSFLDTKYADQIAQNANFGLAKKLYDQLSNGL